MVEFVQQEFFKGVMEGFDRCSRATTCVAAYTIEATRDPSSAPKLPELESSKNCPWHGNHGCSCSMRDSWQATLKEMYEKIPEFAETTHN